MAAAPAVADVVRARQFQVMDVAGKTRAALFLDNAMPGLVLFDAAGKNRARLIVEQDGTPSLVLSDAAGKMRATLGASSLNNVQTGETRNRSESSLVLFGKDGKVIWEAP